MEANKTHFSYSASWLNSQKISIHADKLRKKVSNLDILSLETLICRNHDKICLCKYVFLCFDS